MYIVYSLTCTSSGPYHNGMTASSSQSIPTDWLSSRTYLCELKEISAEEGGLNLDGAPQLHPLQDLLHDVLVPVQQRLRRGEHARLAFVEKARRGGPLGFGRGFGLADARQLLLLLAAVAQPHNVRPVVQGLGGTEKLVMNKNWSYSIVLWIRIRSDPELFGQIGHGSGITVSDPNLDLTFLSFEKKICIDFCDFSSKFSYSSLNTYIFTWKSLKCLISLASVSLCTYKYT